MKIGYEAAYISGRVGPARLFVFCLEIIDQRLGLFIPMVVISLVDTVDLAFFRDADMLVGEKKLANTGVQGEAMDTVPRGIDHNGA